MHHTTTQTKQITTVSLSEHARTRAQQRGIRSEELDALLSYGIRTHDHFGGLICTFDEEGLTQLRQEASPALWRRMQDRRHIYAVIAEDGSVITTGHRVKRVVRDRSQAAHRRAALVWERHKCAS